MAARRWTEGGIDLLLVKAERLIVGDRVVIDELSALSQASSRTSRPALQPDGKPRHRTLNIMFRQPAIQTTVDTRIRYFVRERLASEEICQRTTSGGVRSAMYNSDNG